jgi:hypothetical protein
VSVPDLIRKARQDLDVALREEGDGPRSPFADALESMRADGYLAEYRRTHPTSEVDE